MSNRSRSGQHGLNHHTLPGNGRPKSKDRKRANKARAAELREERRAEAKVRLAKKLADQTK